MEKLPFVDVGFRVFIEDGGEAVGAVRDVAPDGRPELRIFVENAGEFTVPLSAVRAVGEQKVVLAAGRLDDALRRAIGGAHQAEQPGL